MDLTEGEYEGGKFHPVFWYRHGNFLGSQGHGITALGLHCLSRDARKTPKTPQKPEETGQTRERPAKTKEPKQILEVRKADIHTESEFGIRRQSLTPSPPLRSLFPLFSLTGIMNEIISPQSHLIRVQWNVGKDIHNVRCCMLKRAIRSEVQYRGCDPGKT